jgi:hypothetical protein
MQPSNNLKTVIKIDSSQQVTYESQHNCLVQTAHMVPPSNNKSDHNQSSQNVNFRSQTAQLAGSNSSLSVSNTILQQWRPDAR